MVLYHEQGHVSKIPKSCHFAGPLLVDSDSVKTSHRVGIYASHKITALLNYKCSENNPFMPSVS
jgi:hypothetical protein